MSDKPTAAQLDEIGRIRVELDRLSLSLMRDGDRLTIGIALDRLATALDRIIERGILVTREQAQRQLTEAVSAAVQKEAGGYARGFLLGKVEGAQIIMDALTPAFGLSSPLPPTEENIQKMIRILDQFREHERKRYEAEAHTNAAVAAALEQAAEIVRIHSCCLDGKPVLGMVTQEIRSLITQPQQDALAHRIHEERRQEAELQIEHANKRVAAEEERAQAIAVDKAFDRLWELMRDGLETQRAMMKVKGEMA